MRASSILVSFFIFLFIIILLHPVNIEKRRQLRAVHEPAKTCLHGAHISLYVHPKNRQISFRGEWYLNHQWMAQHRFAVPFTHMCIWFANCSEVVCEPFSMLVYTRLYSTHSRSWLAKQWKNSWVGHKKPVIR